MSYRACDDDERQGITSPSQSPPSSPSSPGAAAISRNRSPSTESSSSEASSTSSRQRRRRRRRHHQGDHGEKQQQHHRYHHSRRSGSSSRSSRTDESSKSRSKSRSRTRSRSRPRRERHHHHRRHHHHPDPEYEHSRDDSVDSGSNYHQQRLEKQRDAKQQIYDQQKQKQRRSSSGSSSENTLSNNTQRNIVGDKSFGQQQQRQGKMNDTSVSSIVDGCSSNDLSRPLPPPKITKPIQFGKPGTIARPGIQMKLGSVKQKIEPTKKITVASVFNNDSDDEIEEMPPECKMRMRNIGRDTPTSSGPNSFGKTKQGFIDSKKLFEKTLRETTMD